jgi:hypothetical protein
MAVAPGVATSSQMARVDYPLISVASRVVPGSRTGQRPMARSDLALISVERQMCRRYAS